MRLPARLVVGAALAALAFGAFSLPSRSTLAYAQNLGQRVVAGAVVDAGSSPLEGATVFLRNEKSKSIRSYTSAKDGRFRFTQVSMSDDFELWAEKNGKKSATKTVSSWDTRKEAEYELKIK